MTFQEHVKQAEEGTVPWDVDECMECLLYCQELAETPVDDWDLQPREVVLAEGADGKPAKISLNAFDGLAQVSFYLAERYPWKESFTHGVRVMQIAQFFEDFRSRLAEDGFVETDAAGEPAICRSLIQALATLPFTKQVDGEAGHVYKVLDYDLVASTARELMD